ncbi:MAG: cobaltochelatase subunit CobN, partial [Pseudomonadota bacterium]
VDIDGASNQAVFKRRLANTSQSFLGRASNLYGLVDNNDAFDYLGGLNLAVESIDGDSPTGFVIDVSNPQRPTMPALQSAIVSELRGRQLNPAWIQSLMPHGYAGARTMNVAFFENLWGWEVTDPTLFPDTIWDDTKAVYLDDRYDIGVGEFLNEPANQPVQANMIAIMLVAAQREFWQTDDQTITELGERFAGLVARVGLPGSGHTRPDHPMLDWIAERISAQARAELTAARNAARGNAASQSEPTPPQSIRELTRTAPDDSDRLQRWTPWLMLLLATCIIASGFVHSRRLS